MVVRVLRSSSLAVAAFLASGVSAYAMEGRSVGELSCTVFGADKLPPEIGADVLCTAIRTAAGANSGGAVVLRVKSPYAVSATVTDRGGRKLPEIGTAIADRTLNRRSIEMLATEIARQLRSGGQETRRS